MGDIAGGTDAVGVIVRRLADENTEVFRLSRNTLPLMFGFPKYVPVLTIGFKQVGPVAQGLEQATHNRLVIYSHPINSKTLTQTVFFSGPLLGHFLRVFSEKRPPPPPAKTVGLPPLELECAAAPAISATPCGEPVAAPFLRKHPIQLRCSLRQGSDIREWLLYS